MILIFFTINASAAAVSAFKGDDFLSEKSYLHIFPVGQGSCNLIIHTDVDDPKSFYGIMYDCGTSGTGSLPILWNDPSNPFQIKEYNKFYKINVAVCFIFVL